MKKTIYIVVPILLAVVLAATGVLLWVLNGLTNAQSPEAQVQYGEVTVYDSQGAELLRTTEPSDVYLQEYWAYLETVFAEVAEIVAEQKQISREDALEWFFQQGGEIYTTFDPIAFTALKEVELAWGKTCNTAGAITDLNGNLLAVYCTDLNGKQINYTQDRRSPYSSFKALSVYTPAVEKGLVNWSTLYADTPYKQLTEEDGTERDWPANASGTYSKENVTVYDALRKSLNTVAVKCLADLGVQNSIDFLQDNFGIALQEEEFVVGAYGAEEAIGSVALGYLETGITPIEMAGYYQIFGNGGMYAEPTTVISATTTDQSLKYIRNTEAKRVISAATSDLMNKLLQGVVTEGGTGAPASCGEIEVAGKTGTGDGYADNWFVGVTPGYSVAMWHGEHRKNEADEMFATVVQALYRQQPSAHKQFLTHHNLHQGIYCIHSGKAFSANCTLIDFGYYVSPDALQMCDVCANKKVGGQ